MNTQFFLERFKDALEMEHDKELSLSDKFQELEEWDSLSLLSVVAFLDEEYNFVIETEDLKKLDTIQELVNAIGAKT